MNDKIKQLAEQADWRFSDKITGDELQPILDKRLEKFAELIVRECAQVDADFVPGYGLEPFSKRFKEHYGVEE